VRAGSHDGTAKTGAQHRPAGERSATNGANPNLEVHVTKRILLAVSALAFSTPALAEGPYYVGAHVGLSLFSDSDASQGGGSATISYKTGFDIGGVVGYRYNENFRFEGEFSYKGADMDKVSAGGQSATLSDSSLSTYGFLVNAYYDIVQAKLPVTPFLGVGLGGIYGKAKSQGTSDHDTQFGYQFTGGILYSVNKNFLLSAAYRYQGSSDFSASGTTLSYGSHNLLVGGMYFF
jgi:opacity protein-like surface antigen